MVLAIVVLILWNYGEVKVKLFMFLLGMIMWSILELYSKRILYLYILI